MKTKKRKTKKGKTKKRRGKTYSSSDYKSNEGMLTTIWGPSLWHTLHVMSFNYPINPTAKNKKDYKRFVNCLRCTLPCGKCRKNLKKNLKDLPLRNKDLKNRERFSRWMFNLHEMINTMLKKKSGLTYEVVRDRYEHFRSRCTDDKNKTRKNKTRKKKCIKKEDGCIVPLYGKKSKCLIRIVPNDSKAKTLKIDKKCIRTR
jgi:hypothetical protein